MGRAEFVMREVFRDKWLDGIMIVLIAPIIVGIFTTGESVANSIAEYTACLLGVCFIIRLAYIIRKANREFIPEG